MFRQIAAIVLLLTFAAYSFHQAVIVLDYYANTASFARACENKARPMMHCNGKCQMMKKLKEEEKKEGQNPTRKNENKDEVVYTNASVVAVANLSQNSSKRFYAYPDTPFPKGVYASVFHPPALV